MGDRVKKITLFLCIYALLFWIGFRSGEIHNRMKNKVVIEKIVYAEKEQPKLRTFYIVEVNSIAKVDENHVFIEVFLNEKLRYLLKKRPLLEIYDKDGARVY